LQNCIRNVHRGGLRGGRRGVMKIMVDKQQAARGYGRIFLAAVMMVAILACGCSQLQVRSSFEEANALFSQGRYGDSLGAYELIGEQYPDKGDRVLFEMGIIYAYPKNERKDYRKALDCFEKLIREYPGSTYRHESERMIFQINNVTAKDRMISSQQSTIDTLRQEVKHREKEIAALQKTIDALEEKQATVIAALADRVLIEKGERRLTLFSGSRVLKSYRIALGGNPNGPKEMQGDNRTPEGIYFIDSRNKDSLYHISLHISYPNERDRKRARELGVSPGGDIMIHGIKNGYSDVGNRHAGVDWTKGCIAVTDDEIEEIEKMVPNGTVVEIRP
jgi:tetratricopeptide (TPR) repeat protein